MFKPANVLRFADILQTEISPSAVEIPLIRLLDRVKAAGSKGERYKAISIVESDDCESVSTAFAETAKYPNDA